MFSNSFLPNPQAGHWAKSPPQRLIKPGALLHCELIHISPLLNCPPYDFSPPSRLLPGHWGGVLWCGGQGEGNFDVWRNCNQADIISTGLHFGLNFVESKLKKALFSSVDIFGVIEMISVCPHDPRGPLWCLIDLYGSCSAIELEDSPSSQEEVEEVGGDGESLEPSAPPLMLDTCPPDTSPLDTFPSDSSPPLTRGLTPPPSYENLFSYRGNNWSSSSINISQNRLPFLLQCTATDWQK